jgi:hypothetical protein
VLYYLFGIVAVLCCPIHPKGDAFDSKVPHYSSVVAWWLVECSLAKLRFSTVEAYTHDWP